MNLGMESEKVEFKKSTNELTKAIISVSAMLNKHGEGTIYFGVNPKGDVVGIKDANDSTVRDISRKIAEGIKPQIIPTISVEYIGELKIIKVYVKGNNKPYSAFGKFYNRSFDEDRGIEPEQIRELINEYEEPDLITKEPSTKDNLTFKLLKDQFSIQGLTINSNKFIENTNLFTTNGNFNYMAEILADENDVSIKVVTFEGTDKSKVLTRTEYGYKCLIVAINQVLQYIESINVTKVKIGGFKRLEENYFDFNCFKEAWLNACVHNKWIERIPPAVYIFDDRIEIVSNGGLPKSLTKEDFFKGVSKPVNEKLLNIFAKLDIIDQTGHGIPLILQKYGRDAFYISEHTIIVTIPFNKELLDKVELFYDDLNENEIKILNEIRNNSYITTLNLSNITSIGESYVNKILQNLKTKGYIERSGAKKNGSWKILK